MKVSELIEKLSKAPGYAEVIIEWGGTLVEGTSPVSGVRVEQENRGPDETASFPEVYLEY